MRRYVLSLAVGLLATAAVPGVAAAATDAVTTAELNMRAGPSTGYPVVEVLPDNVPVTVYGCVGDYAWCDVSWNAARGWVSGSYLTSYVDSRYVPIIEYGPTVGLPVVDFVFDTYWDTYYRGRSWYGHRARWRNYWREHRHDIRAHRRDDRRDARAEQRENRVELRGERRQERAERRDDRRDARTERRQKRVQQLRSARNARVQQRRVQRHERSARRPHVERRNIRAQRQAPRRQMQSRGPGRSVHRGGGGGRSVQRGGGGGRGARSAGGGGGQRRGG